MQEPPEILGRGARGGIVDRLNTNADLDLPEFKKPAMREIDAGGVDDLGAVAGGQRPAVLFSPDDVGIIDPAALTRAPDRGFDFTGQYVKILHK